MTTSFGSNIPKDHVCGLERFGAPLEYLIQIESLDVFLSEFSHKLNIQRNLLKDFENQLKQSTYSVTVSEDLQSRDYTDGKNSAGSLSSNSSIEFSQSLNFKEIQTRKNLLVLRKLIAEQELKRLDVLHRVELFQRIVGIAESQAFGDIVSKKLEQRKMELKFYDEKFESGEIDQANYLAVKTAIRRLRDQSIANKIRLTNIYGELGITGLQLNTHTFFENVGSSLSAFDNCDYVSFEALTINSEILLKTEEFNTLSSSENFDLNFVASISESRNVSKLSDTEAKLGIKLSVPLFDGGANRDEREKKLNEISSLQSYLKNTKKNEVSALDERVNAEFIYHTSLKSISDEMKDIEDRIDELKVREKLGQSIFLEKSSAYLEFFGLEESAMRIKKDFLNGWLVFVSKRFEKE